MDDSDYDEEAGNLLDGETKRFAYRDSKQQVQHKWPWFLTAFLIYLVTLLVTFRLGGSWYRHHARRPLEDDRPLYAGMDRDSMHWVNFSAFSLHPSRYTAAPGPSVEQAWRELGVEYLTFIVPIDQGPAFSVSEDHVVIPADAPGAHGNSGYGVDMEAMHQLHCVNLLRKGQYFNHAHYHASERIHERPSMPFRDPEHVLKAHINHCIDALRERIICAADNNVIPYYWRDRQGNTITDFAVSRQCKSFEAVRSFAEKYQVDEWGDSYELTTPEGAYLASDLMEGERR